MQESQSETDSDEVSLSQQVTAQVSFHDGRDTRQSSLQLVTAAGEKTYQNVRDLSLMSTRAVLGEVSGLEAMDNIQLSVHDAMNDELVVVTDKKVLEQCIRRHRLRAAPRFEERLNIFRKKLQADICSRYRGGAIEDDDLIAMLKGLQRIFLAVSCTGCFHTSRDVPKGILLFDFHYNLPCFYKYVNRSAAANDWPSRGREPLRICSLHYGFEHQDCPALFGSIHDYLLPRDKTKCALSTREAHQISL